MADNSAERVTHGSVGTTAETSWLTRPHNKVSVTNTHATQRCHVRVFSGATAAAAKALADATDAVANADEVYDLGPGEEEVVFRSTGAKFVALSVIGSGAATTYEVVGESFQEGD